MLDAAAEKLTITSNDVVDELDELAPIGIKNPPVSVAALLPRISPWQLVHELVEFVIEHRKSISAVPAMLVDSVMVGLTPIVAVPHAPPETAPWQNDTTRLPAELAGVLIVAWPLKWIDVFVVGAKLF